MRVRPQGSRMARAETGNESVMAPSQARKMKRIVFPREQKWGYSARQNIVVSTCGIPRAFRQSFLRILTGTSDCYRGLFGQNCVGAVEMNVHKASKMDHRLWTNGADRIYFTLSRKRQLEPPDRSCVFNIHGITHELAHIVLYRSLINIRNLSAG